MSEPNRRIRVLWFAKGLGPGGMERLLVNHAQAGDHSRFEYQAAYLVPRPNSVVPELEALGVRCTRLGLGSRLDISWVLALRGLIRQENIEIVHAHSPLPAAVARVVSRTLRRRPRVVYTEHNSWDCYSRPTRLLNAVTYPLDDAQVAVSAAAKQSVPSLFRGHIEVLTHGIDLDGARSQLSHRAKLRADLGITASDVVSITVANLRTEKAYEVLLRAAAESLKTNPDLLFLSVGHGPLESEMKALSASLGLGDRFRFLGFRSDALALMAASDIFVLSSRQEGLPVSLMEAMSLGLPVVATAVGGIPDYVESGRSGLLVNPEQPLSLAKALCRLAEDTHLREEFGSSAREIAAIFDSQLAVDRLDSIYSEVSK